MPKARTTFTLDADLVERLQRCARLQGVSVSSVLNSWLEDTGEALEYLSLRLAQEKGVVRGAVQEINAGLEVMREGYAKVRPGVGPARAARAPGRTPPSCNTGGKFTAGSTKA
jgi:predicted transcriptional regulator